MAKDIYKSIQRSVGYLLRDVKSGASDCPTFSGSLSGKTIR